MKADAGRCLSAFWFEATTGYGMVDMACGYGMANALIDGFERDAVFQPLRKYRIAQPSSTSTMERRGFDVVCCRKGANRMVKPLPFVRHLRWRKSA